MSAARGGRPERRNRRISTSCIISVAAVLKALLPMESLTPYLIAIPALLVLSVAASKGAGRFGIPALSMFLLIGMAVGREGPGGVPFSSYLVAQTLGILALIQILHSGGLSTRLEDVRTVRGSGLVLSTLGVVVATT